MRSFALALLIAAFAPLAARAQVPPDTAEAAAEVRAVVQRLFDGMRAGDSTAVRSVFHPRARLLTVVARTGSTAVQEGSVDGFVQAVGTPHEAVWDEHITTVEVRADGSLATAWMGYAFYQGDTFSHCGVNAFQLAREAGRWQILQVTDTRRRTGCPASVKK